jgi:2-C-methyl-D-erythritol 2,4-cyclodiphosphate synthase
MDALLGAAALGDIGQHFPDTDPAYKDADSIKLLAHVRALLSEKRYSIGNIDITIIAEKPKVMPYSKSMIANLSGALQIPESLVSIKATTNEMIGALGRGEGIAAIAVALIHQ